MIAHSVVVLAFSVFTATVAGQSPDRPKLGDWDFRPQKAWEIDRIDDKPLAKPGELRVATDGMFYFHDFERHVSYACNSDGTLVRTFAKQGGKEGEVSRYLNCLAGGDRVVIVAPDRLYFFTGSGEHINSVPNDAFQRFPLIHLGGEEFLFAPGSLTDVRGDKAQIVRNDVGQGKDTAFVSLGVTSKERGGPPGAVVVGLTPQILMAHDRESGTFYYGKNSEYMIHAADANGKTLASFGLKRTKVSVGKEAKKAHFAALGVPSERAEKLVNALPDEATYYHRLQVNNGLIYVFAVAGIGLPQDSQQIDVFSPDGTYLYRASIRLPDGRHIRGSADNLRLQGDKLYVILEDAKGTKSIAQFDITLPTAETRESTEHSGE